MRILVTGASGVIGTPLVSRLIEQGHDLTALIRSEHIQQHSDLKCVLWNWTDTEIPPSLDLDFEVIIHLGGQTDAYRARANYVEDARQNIVSFLKFLDHTTKNRSFPHFILAGTATDVGRTSGIVTESVPIAPVTFYDLLKVTQQSYLRLFAQQNRLTFTALRLSNVYGSAQGSSSERRGFLDQSIRRALRGETLNYFRGQQMRRDFIHISDVVSAFEAVANERTGNCRGYLIGTGTGTPIQTALESLVEIANVYTGLSAIASEIDAPTDLELIEYRDVGVSPSEFMSAYHWNPCTKLLEGLERSVRMLI